MQTFLKNFPKELDQFRRNIGVKGWRLLFALFSALFVQEKIHAELSHTGSKLEATEFKDRQKFISSFCALDKSWTAYLFVKRQDPCTPKEALERTGLFTALRDEQYTLLSCNTKYVGAAPSLKLCFEDPISKKKFSISYASESDFLREVKMTA